MSIQVNEVINRALRLIRAESSYQDFNDDARTYVLNRLNNILAELNATGLMLPYQTNINFTLQPQKSTYTIGTAATNDVVVPHALVALDYVNLLVEGYQYPVEILDNFAVLSNITTDTFSGRPRQVLVTLQNEATTLKFYGTPDQAYECVVRTKVSLGGTDYNGTIELPAQYHQYLIYTLAKRSNIEQGIGTWTPIAEQEYQVSTRRLKAATYTDNRVRSAPPINHYRGEYTWYLGVVRG